MVIEPCTPATDFKRHEQKNHGTPMFPCGGYETVVGDSKTRFIPWHWHEELEVIFVKSGVLKVDVPQQSILVNAGEAVFINASVLQTVVNEGGVCEIHTLVFSPQFIAGGLESAIEQKYIRPLIHCPELRLIRLTPLAAWHKGAVDCIKEAFSYFKSAPFGFEMLVRNALSALLFLIITNNKEALFKQKTIKDTATARTKAMLSYIDANYKEQITLEDIASAASVSGRECLRCFNQALGTTPMKYLLRYRIAVAAGLLATGDLSITEICAQSGFESPSYFSLKFKELTGITPTEYRRGL